MKPPYLTPTKFDVITDDCVEAMAGMEPESIEAIVCDPPYGLEFMGKEFDKLGPGPKQQEWHHTWAKQALRVLKPGGHLLAFGGTRTFHRLACAFEDAGFEIRDTLMWLYGSGFPKSKKLDGDWDGFGTALKPAYEPIIMARKPLTGTVAQNVVAHGTGALNIDGCRVEGGEISSAGGTKRSGGIMGKSEPLGGWSPQHSGRWPANVILSHHPECEYVGVKKVKGDDRNSSSGSGRDGGGFVDVGTERSSGEPGGGVYPSEEIEDWSCHPECPVRLLDEQTVELHKAGNINPSYSQTKSWKQSSEQRQIHSFGDTGGASRFFYCAKASRSERQAGLPKGMKNAHPTVKPVDVMAYLCRLVTPPGGTVLDPFCGSGSTGIAARLEGFHFIGIEMDEESVEVARRRIDHYMSYRKDVDGKPLHTKKKKIKVSKGQLDLI